MQTNRYLGAWTMHLHGYDPPNDPLHAAAIAKGPPPCPWDQGGSPNHIAEALSVNLRLHRNDGHRNDAFGQAIDYLEDQRDYGHCCHAQACETLTDSHAPIWYRAQASMLITALDMGTGPVTGALGWWARELYLCDLLAVPVGPLAGQVVGIGGRFARGVNDTRNVCYSLIRTRRARKGTPYWGDAAVYQDNFASLLVRGLVAAGTFKGLATVKPVLPFKLTVSHYTDGHFCTTDRPINKQGDGKPDPTCVAVKYSTGEVTTDGRAADVDLGEHERTEAL